MWYIEKWVVNIEKINSKLKNYILYGMWNVDVGGNFKVFYIFGIDD